MGFESAEPGVSLIQRLVPVAVNNVTALDMVLRRLIMTPGTDLSNFPSSLLRLERRIVMYRSTAAKEKA